MGCMRRGGGCCGGGGNIKDIGSGVVGGHGGHIAGGAGASGHGCVLRFLRPGKRVALE